MLPPSVSSTCTEIAVMESMRQITFTSAASESRADENYVATAVTTETGTV